MKLSYLATIKTNHPDADFWIIRKGSESKVGTPVRTFSSEHIGIKVTATDVLIPDYLFYVMEHLVNIGYWKDRAMGTLNLKHITCQQVKDIRFG